MVVCRVYAEVVNMMLFGQSAAEQFRGFACSASAFVGLTEDRNFHSIGGISIDFGAVECLPFLLLLDERTVSLVVLGQG